MERLAEGQLVNQLYVPRSICHTLQYREIFCSRFEKENSLVKIQQHTPQNVSFTKRKDPAHLPLKTGTAGM